MRQRSDVSQVSWSTASAVATPRMMVRVLATFYIAARIAGRDAKAAGRGRVELEGGAGTGLARDLAAALADGDVEVHHQPIVSLADGATVGVEALARWTHPEHGPSRRPSSSPSPS